MCQSQSTFISTPLSTHLNLRSMSIKLTGARLREDCINFITTQSNASEETQKISDDDDYDDIEEEYDIQKGLSFVESLAMLA